MATESVSNPSVKCNPGGGLYQLHWLKHQKRDVRNMHTYS